MWLQRGFTLIEMVITIVLLGIVGLFLGEVIRQSLVLYSDASSREALIQQGRFVTERLRREIREAVPNSVVAENNCLELIPITNSGIYLDIAPPDAPSSSFRVLPMVKSIGAGERLTVYPSSANALRSSVAPIGQIAQVDTDVDFTAPNDVQMVDVPLTQSVGFPISSPASRVYFYRNPVAFCWVGTDLFRYEGYDLDRPILVHSQLGTGLKLAENITNAVFRVTTPKLQRNGLVKIELTFSNNGESVRFDHDALIYNTP